MSSSETATEAALRLKVEDSRAPVLMMDAALRPLRLNPAWRAQRVTPDTLTPQVMLSAFDDEALRKAAQESPAALAPAQPRLRQGAPGPLVLQDRCFQSFELMG